MTLACRGGSVIKYMPKMAAATAAMHFRPCKEEFFVGLRANSVYCHRTGEAWPAGFAVIFIFRCVKIKIAGCALKDAVALFIVKGA